VNPQLYIIAGPNGAGKTTFAKSYLPRYTNSREFVNADEIAQSISPGDPEAAAIRAGREMLTRIKSLAAERADFSIETTLSGKSYVPWLRELKAQGCQIQLFFLWVPEVQMAINRVAARVRQGGHHIPEPVIRRRYLAGIHNLFRVYRPLVNSWASCENSHALIYTIAVEEAGNLMVFDEQKLSKFMKTADETSRQNLQETATPPVWGKASIAMRSAMADVIEQYRKTGNLLVVWRDGKVYHQPPEEAKRELEEAIKNDPCAARVREPRPL
jgi:predicted ABC-type ATPase